MSGWMCEIFEKAMSSSVKGIYKVSVENSNLVFTAVDRIPKVREFLDDYLSMVLEGKYYNYFVTNDLEPDGLFTNPAVLCEDDNYYFYNVHSYIPKYVKPVKDLSESYPESLSECVEVIVK